MSAIDLSQIPFERPNYVQTKADLKHWVDLVTQLERIMSIQRRAIVRLFIGNNESKSSRTEADVELLRLYCLHEVYFTPEMYMLDTHQLTEKLISRFSDVGKFRRINPMASFHLMNLGCYEPEAAVERRQILAQLIVDDAFWDRLTELHCSDH